MTALSPEEIDLVAEWRRRARLSQHGHHEAATRLGRLHLAVGLPTVALSAFVGTTVFSSLGESASKTTQVVVAIAAALAAVLAAIQTFLRLAEKAEAHRATSAVYGAIRRELDAIEATGSAGSGLERVRERLDSVASSAPSVPKAVSKRVGAKLDAPTGQPSPNSG